MSITVQDSRIVFPENYESYLNWIENLNTDVKGKSYNLLYIYRTECPYSKKFSVVLSKFVSVLCDTFPLTDMSGIPSSGLDMVGAPLNSEVGVPNSKDSKIDIKIGNIEKSIFQGIMDPYILRLAPVIPSVLFSVSNGGEVQWRKLNSNGETTRTPFHLLKFASEVWNIEGLKPIPFVFETDVLEVGVPESKIPKIAKSEFSVIYIDYLELRDYPVTEGLKGISNHTLDLMILNKKSKICNRTTLPETHPLYLNSSIDRQQEDPMYL